MLEFLQSISKTINDNLAAAVLKGNGPINTIIDTIVMGCRRKGLHVSKIRPNSTTVHKLNASPKFNDHANEKANEKHEMNTCSS